MAFRFLGGGLRRWSARRRVSTRGSRTSSASLRPAEVTLMISGEMPGPDEFPSFLLKAYGVRIHRVGPGPNGEEVYRSEAGDLVTTLQQGALGSQYWQALRGAPGQAPVELIRVRKRAETGEARQVTANCWGG